MIRSFLLDHEIEAHVLHENAGHLWAGAVADCVLAVHETDLGFLDEAFSASRERLTDESEFAKSGFDEQDSAPLKFGWNFFFTVGLTGLVMAWATFLLSVMWNALSEKMRERIPGVAEYRQPIEFTDLAVLTGVGILAGLCWAVAIPAARLLRPDEHGKFSINARCFIFLILWFTYNPILPIMWFLRSSFH